MRQENKLPPRRRQILDFLRKFIEENVYPPTIRDIQRALNISSTSVVDYNLSLLSRDGYLNRRPEVARGIELLDESGRPMSPTPRVSIVGVIAAGLPLPVFSTEGAASSAEFDTIDVSPDLLRRHGRLYGLLVKGNSMIDALIDDGDVVIVKPAQQAETGDMVVAWLKDQEEATLKKFYPEGELVRLQPANRQMSPIYCSASNVEVRGKVVEIRRKF
jgi:repressor LexA